MSYGSKYIRSIEIIGVDTAKTELVYNIKKVSYVENGFRFFINIHTAIYKRLYEDVEKGLRKNPAFKIQTVCQYSYEYNTIRDCGDNDYYHDVNPSNNAFATSKSVEQSLISIDDTLQSQKMEVQKKIEDKADSSSISRVEKIIITI